MTEYCYKTCPVCGVQYALEKTYNDYRLKGGSGLGKQDLGWHCPNGHSLVFTETEADKLRRERDSLKQQQARLYERISEEQKRTEHEKNRANGYKGHATRITKRAKAGVCPCCNRTFKQLAQHMANKHPTFTPISLEDRPPEGATVQ
jgi:hypothetical protein